MVSIEQSYSLDFVCCSHVIEHVDNDDDLVRLFYSILSPGGYLLLNVPINEVWNDPNHVRKYTVSTLMEMLEGSGFIVDKVQEVDRWSAWILHHEKVSKKYHQLLLKLVRLALVLMPTHVTNKFERLLPAKYKFQQLLILARKA